MAPKSRILGELLHFASTSRSTSMVTLAAVSFAVCHGVAIASSPLPSIGGEDLDAQIPRQLIHFFAELGRFALPLAFMVVAFARRAGAAGISPRKLSS
jgi:hypothetical protein